MNAEDPSIGLNTKPLVDGVDKAETALDRLIRSLQTLDRFVASSAGEAKKNTDALSQAFDNLNGSKANAFTKAFQTGLTSVSNGTADALKLTKEIDGALQGAFEARLLMVSKMTNEELRIWKEFGVKLNGIQKAQLKGYSPDALTGTDPSAMQQKLYSKAGTLAADNSPLKSIRAAVAGDSDFILARLNKHYADQERILANIAQTSQAPSALSSIRKATEVDSAAILSEMASFYQSQQSLSKVYGKVGSLAMDSSPLRSIRASTEADADILLARMNKFYADQERILNNIAKKEYAFSPLSSIRKQTELDSAAILSSMSNFYAQQQRFASVKAGTGVSIGNTSYNTEDRSKAVLSGMSAYYSALQSGKTAAQAMEAANLPVAESIAQVDAKAKQSATGLNLMKTQANDVHSAMRGLASGFNLLWLTWGNLAPLFIGAAISNSFVQVAKTGMAVEQTLATIGNVGGATGREVDSLREKLLAMSQTGPFGPVEVAEAMKMLSLAGLEANEILSVTQDVLNFSVAGTTDIKTAAETLMAVSTAFNMGSSGFARVSDVISKAAAESMTSVEAFSAAMKTASVINAQYGVSLEDTATSIAALANLGIQASAAGTAVRNAYADLSGRSMQVAKVLKQQGIELRDSTGAFKPLVAVVDELNKKFSELDGIGQKNLMQALLSERGAKSIVELLRMVRTEAKDMGSGLTNALEEMRQKIGDSAGFAAVTAAKMAQTAENQFKTMQSSLSSALASAFKSMEPSLLLITNRMTQVFASPEFQSAISSLVLNVATLATVFANHAEIILKVAVVYGGMKLAAMALVPVLTSLSTVKWAEVKATMAKVVALDAETAASLRAKAASLGTLGVLGRVAGFLPVLGTALSLVTGAWMAYEFFSTKASDNAADAAANSHNNLMDTLKQQAEKLEYINALRAEGLDQREAELRFDSLKGSGLTTGKAQAQDNLAKALADQAKAKQFGSPQTRFDANEAVRVADAEVLKYVRREQEAEAMIERIKRGQSRKNRMDSDEAAAAAAKAAAAFSGTNTFSLAGTGGAGGGYDPTKNALNDLDSMVRSQKASNAELEVKLENLKKVVPLDAEALRIESDKARAISDLNEKYDKAAKVFTDAKKNVPQELKDAKTEVQTLIDKNYQLSVEFDFLQKLKTQKAANRAEEAAQLKEFVAANTVRMDELAKLKKANEESEAALGRTKSQLGTSAFQQGLEGRLLDVRKNYAATREKLNSDFSRLDMSTMSYDQYTEQENKFNRDMGLINEEQAKALALASSQAYQENWNTAITNISSNFVDKMMDGTLNLKDFMIDSFATMVLQPQLNLVMQKGFDFLLGGSGGLLGSLLSFDGGGSTGTGARSGGLDGKGGFIAMLHPKETVVDHTKGQSAASSGGAPVYITINQTVGDIATKSMLAEMQQSTVKQVQAGIARSQRYRGALANG